MVEYNKVNVKLSDRQMKQLKTSVKNKSETTLRVSLKMFYGNNLRHKLLSAIRQKNKAKKYILITISRLI